MSTTRDTTREHRLRRWTLGSLLGSLWALAVLPGVGANDAAGIDPSIVGITARDAQHFAERFFDEAREEYPHAGAAIAVVHHGALICAGGFGQYAIDDNRPVDAERGLVDLDTDVNRYLTSFAIPDTFDEPITLRHLLTHTPGFDDTAIGSITRDVESLTGLETYLATHMPARLRPPLPPELAANATPGHIIAPDGSIRAVPHLYGEIYPAGTGYFTAKDLALFMTAHLQSGGPILRPETVQTMHARAFSNDDRLPGMALGFIEGEVNGVRTLWHIGTSPAGSHGILVLVPSTGTGLVMLANTVNSALSSALVRGFFDEFFPNTAAGGARQAGAVPGTVVAAAGLQSPAGRYRQNWYAHQGIEKIDAISMETRIADAGDGTIRARFEDGVSRDYVAIAPDLYEEVDRGALLSVERDADGPVVRLYRGDRPIVAYEPPGVQETAASNIVLMNLSLTLLGALAAQPIAGAIVSRITRRERPAWTARDRLARSLGVATGWLGVAFFGGYAAILVLAGTASILRSPFAVIVFNLPGLLILLAVALAVAAVSAWKGRASLVSRIHLSLLSPAALALAWFAWQWNVLGYMGYMGYMG